MGSRCPFLISTGPATMKHWKSTILCLALVILIVTEAVDEATIPLVKTETLGSVEAESGQTSLPVLASATTTSSTASQLSQQHQGNPVSASVTSTSYASPKGCPA